MAVRLIDVIHRACGFVARRGKWHARESRQRMLADRARRATEALEARVMLSGYGFDFPGEVAPEYGVGSVPRSVVAADFDGDGKADLATANSSSNTVSVLLNKATAPSPHRLPTR